MIGGQELSMLPKDAIVINTSGGRGLDLGALAASTASSMNTGNRLIDPLPLLYNETVEYDAIIVNVFGLMGVVYAPILDCGSQPCRFRDTGSRRPSDRSDRHFLDCKEEGTQRRLFRPEGHLLLSVFICADRAVGRPHRPIRLRLCIRR